MSRLLAGAAALVVACTSIPAVNAQQEPRLVPWPVQGQVSVLAGAGANVVVQVGALGVVVVDTGRGETAAAVRDAIREMSVRPIRHVINTHAHPDHVGGNEALARAGAAIQPRGVATVGAGARTAAEIIAHERTLNRMSAPAGTAAPTPVAAWPTATFSGRTKEFFFNDEGIQIVHQPNSHTDGDVIVYFRRSDVIAAGDVYSTESYPVIDLERGGSIQGTIDALNFLLALAIAGEKTEGGTMIVPGHGRISDEADLVEYRDMVTIVRDRVRDLVQKGQTLEQVKGARPTIDFDALYGAAPGASGDHFVETVFRSLPGLRPR